MQPDRKGHYFSKYTLGTFFVLPTTLRNIIYIFFGVFESPQKSWWLLYYPLYFFEKKKKRWYFVLKNNNFIY